MEIYSLPFIIWIVFASTILSNFKYVKSSISFINVISAAIEIKDENPILVKTKDLLFFNLLSSMMW